VPVSLFSEKTFAPGSPENDDSRLGRPTASPRFVLAWRISLSMLFYLIASRSIPPLERRLLKSFARDNCLFGNIPE
jgi:hypothetical protein